MARKGRIKTKDTAAPEDERQGWQGRLDSGALAIFVLWLMLWNTFVFLGTFAPTRQRIGGVDPVGYYAWAHSLFFDHDLDFANEYAMLNPDRPAIGDTLTAAGAPHTVTGRVGNAFAVGPALWWSPFLGIGHVFATWRVIPADGFSQPYQSAVFYANMFYGLGGALMMYYFLRTWFASGPSAISAIAAWLCSPALYYTYAQEAMSHTCSLFAIALFLFTWARLRGKGPAAWALIGALLGIATLTRWQNGAFALVPVVDLLRRDAKANLPKLAVCGGAAFLLFLPQMLAWKVLYGSFFTIPQGESFMSWLRPNPLRVLFSPAHGLITWTPLCGLGLAGIFFWPTDEPRRQVAICLSIALAVLLYVESCAGNVGWAFGMRRLIDCAPIFALGFALLIEKIGAPWRKSTIMAVIIFGVWNVLFALQYGGILDGLYIDQAFTELAAQHGVEPRALLNAASLPNGEPFNPHAFADAHRFPRDAAPTARQFLYDKLVVLLFVFDKLLRFGG